MNLEEQISAVLSDPEAMNKISSIMGALGAQAGPQEQAAAPPPQQPSFQLPPLSDMRLPDMGGDNRTKLLMALKPFLSQKRASYVDGAIALLGMMQLGKIGGSLGPLMSAFGGKSGQ